MCVCKKIFAFANFQVHSWDLAGHQVASSYWPEITTTSITSSKSPLKITLHAKPHGLYMCAFWKNGGKLGEFLCKLYSCIAVHWVMPVGWWSLSLISSSWFGQFVGASSKGGALRALAPLAMRRGVWQAPQRASTGWLGTAAAAARPARPERETRAGKGPVNRAVTDWCAVTEGEWGGNAVRAMRVCAHWAERCAAATGGRTQASVACEPRIGGQSSTGGPRSS